MEKHNNSKSDSKLTNILKLTALIMFLIISFAVLKRGEELNNKNNPNLEKDIELFSDSQGNPALAIGNCRQDSDCSPTGCSLQLCSDHDVVTTCELGEFPEKETYTCGCYESKCVWHRYR